MVRLQIRLGIRSGNGGFDGCNEWNLGGQAAHPLMQANSLPAAKAKMAMSVKGKSRHYHWQRIEPRHFMSTAKAVGFSAQRAQQLLLEFAENTTAVIRRVETLLPHDFPAVIADSIFNGLQERADLIREVYAGCTRVWQCLKSRCE